MGELVERDFADELAEEFPELREREVADAFVGWLDACYGAESLRLPGWWRVRYLEYLGRADG